MSIKSKLSKLIGFASRRLNAFGAAGSGARPQSLEAVIAGLARDPNLDLRACGLLNRGCDDAHANYALRIIHRAVELGLISAPRRIRSKIAAKDVLHLGCPAGLQAVGFVLFGAGSYTAVGEGLDAAAPACGQGIAPCEFDNAHVAAAMPRVRLLPDGPSALGQKEAFDLVVLNTHAAPGPAVRSQLDRAMRHLRPGGVAVIQHQNSYGPRLTQGQVSWDHVAQLLEADPATRPLTLHELELAIRERFDLRDWKPSPAKEVQKSARLTEMREHFPQLGDADLTTEEVLWTARAVKKGVDSVFPSGFADKPDVAVEAYWALNHGMPDAARNYAPELIRRAVEFNYLSWPKKIRADIVGKDVADVGCGTGIHAIGFVVVGVKSYTGVDPRVDPDSDQARNLRKSAWESFGATGREIMGAMPRIRLFKGGVEELPPDEQFDVVVLHNVTEHLRDLEGIFAAVAARLREDGKLLFNHHNFYCWNGHHLAPKTVERIDPNDQEQKLYMDWAHLDFDPPEDHYIARGLNRIRLHELRDLTWRYFDIVEWNEVESKESQGKGRLTPEIRTRHPLYRAEEFLIQNVLCRAVRKGRGALWPRELKSRYRDFARDAAFLEFYDRCNRYSMTTMERLYGVYRAVQYLVEHDIPGDIVECGVWRGGSSMMAALSLRHFGDRHGRRIYLYDTYTGMSEPTDEDFKFGEGKAREKWERTRNDGGSNWNRATVDEVRLNMESTLFDPERLVLVKGKVEDTIPSIMPGEIAMLRLDTDFYASTKHELERLYPLLRTNGVLIIDDYGTWAGSRQAVDEYFADHGGLPLLHRLDVGGRMCLKPGA
jgi:SAM-dependent methyltransferase